MIYSDCHFYRAYSIELQQEFVQFSRPPTTFKLIITVQKENFPLKEVHPV